MSELIQDRPVVTPDAGDSSPRGRQRWFVVIAASALGGLLLGGAYLLLFSGDDPATVDPIAAAPAASAAPASGDAAASDDAAGSGDAATAADPAESPSTEAAGSVTRTTVKMTSRDPFAPLVAKADDTAAASAASSADAKAEEPTQKAAGATISALKISPLGNSATLKLDGKKYEVDEGETFASSYRLYDIFNANCAGFLYGDQNAVVCEGDSVQIG